MQALLMQLFVRTTILPSEYDLAWFSSQGAIVPLQRYTVEIYSSTDLVNWSLIKSENIESFNKILFLKTLHMMLVIQ